MLFRTKYFELEIANFFFLRVPLLGSLYVGPNSGYGYFVRNSSRESHAERRAYIDRTRKTLRAQRR